MFQYNEDSCKIYANLSVYKNKLKNTQKAIKDMLKICDKPYVAFSCGKDSSVLADMVLRIKPTIPLRFISSGETRILHNVDDVINYFVKKYDANVEEICFDRVWTNEWRNATFDEQRKAGNKDIQTISNAGYDGVFMGLRIEESRGRSISLKQCKTEGLPRFMYRYANKDFYRMCPLASWKTADIGAYILENDIPFLNWYHKYGFEGRTTARLTGDSVRQNTLYYIKMTNPEGYSKLIKRFPELGALT